MAMASLGMYKNQLQELAQRSCFNLPSYSCLREGPDHAPRFKATVNFNGELFESPTYCTTLKQAEHAAAEVALIALSKRGGPSQSLAARILEETGVCKNLLQETAQRAGVSLPVYTTIRSGPRHLPVFKCLVEVAGMRFIGDLAKTKKQAEKNAAMAAWTALKRATSERFVELSEATEEQEQRAEWSNPWQHNNSNNYTLNLQSSRSRGWSHDRNLGGNYLASPSALDLSSDGEQSHSYGRSLANKGRVTPSQLRGGLPMRVLEEHIRDDEEWLQLDTPKLGAERDFSSYEDRERINSFGAGILESRRSSSFREEHSNSFSSAWDEHSRILDAKRSNSFREDQSSFGARILDSKRSSSFREDNSSFSNSRILDSSNNSKRSSSFREDRRGICFREDSNSFVHSVDNELSGSFREDCSSLNALDREHSIAFREADRASWNSSQIWLPQPQSQWWVDSLHGSSSGFKPPLGVLPTGFSSASSSSSSSSSSPRWQTHSMKARNINLPGDNFLLASNLAPPVKVRSMVAVCSSPSHYDSIHSQFREAQVSRHSDRSETLDRIPMVNNACFATNLAPPVRVRPMVAVCSAPPLHQDHHSPPQIREIVDNEAVARQMFSRMRL